MAPPTISPRDRLSSLCASIRDAPRVDATATFKVDAKTLALVAPLARLDEEDDGDDETNPPLGQAGLLDAEFLRLVLMQCGSLALTPPWDLSGRVPDLEQMQSLRSLYLESPSPRAVGQGFLKDHRSLLRSLAVTGTRPGALDPSNFISGPFPVLVSLSLRRNGISYLDGQVFELLPRLTRLDLSFNALEAVPGLDSLAGLSNLRLSHNALTALPVLHPNAPLKTLYLEFNKLRDLRGAEKLRLMIELNVSHNLLTSHAVLSSLSPLDRLVRLHLAGNPLAANPKHRMRTLAKMNPRTDPLR